MRKFCFIVLVLSFILASCSTRTPSYSSSDFLVSDIPIEENADVSLSLLSADSVFDSAGVEIREKTFGNAKVVYPFFNSDSVDRVVSANIDSYFNNKKTVDDLESYDFYLTSSDVAESLVFYDATSTTSTLAHRFCITFNKDYTKVLTLSDFITTHDPIEHVIETVDALYGGDAAIKKGSSPDFYVVENGVTVIDELGNLFVIPQEYFKKSPSHRVEVDPSYNPVKSDNEKVIALTFDDGPNYYTTSKLLSLLKEEEVKATFFVVGYNIPGNEFLLRRMRSQGCDIGVHSYGHQNYDLMTREEVLSDIDKCADLVRNAADFDPYLVRAPFGNAPEDIVKEKEYYYINWCVDPYDWLSDSAEDIADHIISHSFSGSIVLMHDLYEHSIDAVAIVIDKLKDDGWRFVTVTELFDFKNNKPNGEIYYGLGI